jgi:hypothetical protein
MPIRDHADFYWNLENECSILTGTGSCKDEVNPELLVTLLSITEGDFLE